MTYYLIILILFSKILAQNFNCGEDIDWPGQEASGEIFSEGWPNTDYPPNQNCRWRLSAPIGVND